MPHYSEYTAPYVQSNACAYSTLSQYNTGCSKRQQARPARVIVPSFSAPPGYSTIARGIPTCSGYADITQTYGSNCTQGINITCKSPHSYRQC